MARRLIALSAVVTLAAACSPATAGSRVRTVEVRVRYSTFEPAVIAVGPGETITFVIENTDPIDHEFIVGDAAVQRVHELGTESHHPPRPGEVTVGAGQTVRTTYTFGERDLIFGCHLPGHYAYGMRGVVEIDRI